MAEKIKEPKRLNRTVGVGEALKGVLDPALKKRGFAGRDIVAHWAAFAPKPYDKVAMPDKLVWPRGASGAEGATLYLRCAPGHTLALAHEGALIAAAVNRYFGYVLVGHVRLSVSPFIPHSVRKPQVESEPDRALLAAVDTAIETVADDGVKEALRRLGEAVMRKPESKD
jgi:hypothetical protein